MQQQPQQPQQPQRSRTFKIALGGICLALTVINCFKSRAGYFRNVCRGVETERDSAYQKAAVEKLYRADAHLEIPRYQHDEIHYHKLENHGSAANNGYIYIGNERQGL